ASNNNSNIINGINFASSTGFNKFLSTPSINISAAGAITGATGVSTTTLTASSTETFSNLTTDKGVLYTNGSGVISQTAQGASNTVLHGNGSGTPTFSAVSLTGDVSGILPILNGGTNTSSVGSAGTV